MKETIPTVDAYIGYVPLPGEADYRTCVSLGAAVPLFLLPQDRSANPFAWAEQCRAAYDGQNVAILVPGTRFDLVGMRHGRGGGWYDRFLSAVPEGWLRIGVAHARQISDEPLVRQAWDEPVDWILSQENGAWSAAQASPRR